MEEQLDAYTGLPAYSFPTYRSSLFRVCSRNSLLPSLWCLSILLPTEMLAGDCTVESMAEMFNHVHIPERHMRHLVRWIVHCAPQCLHQICSNRLNVLIEEIRLQVVHTQLQRTQTLLPTLQHRNYYQVFTTDTIIC
jgi:hypothetical protein